MLAMEGLCRRMERQQTTLLAALEQWPRQQIDFKPSVEAWSAAQVLSHIVKVERGTMVHVRRAIRTQGPQVTKDDERRAHGLIRWLLSSQRVAVPKSEAEEIWPDAEPGFEETAAQWRVARQRLLALARSSENDARCVFTHPGSGPMNLMLVMRFLHAHTRHHEYQMERLRKAAPALRT